MTDNTTRPVLTVEETADALGLCRNTTYLAVREGRIPSIKIGRRVLVPRAALEAMISPPPTAKTDAREGLVDLLTIWGEARPKARKEFLKRIRDDGSGEAA